MAEELYFANLKMQHEKIHFRVPSVPRLVEPGSIPPGQQMRVYRNTRPDVDGVAEMKSIIAQYSPYGLIAAEDIDLKKGHNGLLYSVKGPIDVEKILRGMRANERERQKVAQSVRVDAMNALAEQMQQDSGGGLRELTFTIAEETRPGQQAQMGDEVLTLKASPTRAGGRRRG